MDRFGLWWGRKRRDVKFDFIVVVVDAPVSSLTGGSHAAAINDDEKNLHDPLAIVFWGCFFEYEVFFPVLCAIDRKWGHISIRLRCGSGLPWGQLFRRPVLH